MSFANEVKMEICRRKAGARHCLLAEIAAILLHEGCITSEPVPCLELETDQSLVAERFRYLIAEAFGCGMQDVSDQNHAAGRKYVLQLRDEKKVLRILQALKLEQAEGKLCEQDYAVNEVLLMSSCCRRAFLSGAFLCCGTMSTPEKNYHLEFVCSGSKQAEQLVSLMNFFELEPKITRRKNNQVVYIKEGRQVADMLKVMEATVSLLEYENIRIKREIRGNINRKVNCEAANINKTVAAALEQIYDIELIRDTVGLDSLPAELYQTAEMRMQYPDVALRELGAMMEPPVGKSGMNHRFHKLKQMADEIRKNIT